MKLVNNNKSSNVISTDDINVSDTTSDSGLILTDVIQKYSKSISDLKSAIKYLLMHGGMGGSGGSGSSTTTTMKATILCKYTDMSGSVQSSPITNNTILSVKEGSQLAFTIQGSNFAIDTYGVSLYNSITLATKKSTISTSSSSTILYDIPTNNTTYTITITGTTTISIVFKVFIKNLNIIATIKDANGNSVASESSIVTNVGKLCFTATNYQPDIFSKENNKGFSLDSIDIISTTSKTLTSEYILTKASDIIDSETNQEIYDVSFDLSSLITTNDFGIYNIIFNYTFNAKSISVKINYVYKSEESFAYVYSDNLTVYSIEQEIAQTKTYTGKFINMYMKIYGSSSESITTLYTCKFDFYYSVNNTLTLINDVTFEKTGLYQNTIYSFSFKNPATENAEIKIKITLNSKERNSYYIYLGKTATTRYMLGEGTGTSYKYYYNALVFSTDEDDDNYNIGKIFKDNLTLSNGIFYGNNNKAMTLGNIPGNIMSTTDGYKPIDIKQATDYTIKSIINTTALESMPSHDTSGKTNFDYMLTFAIKYYSNDYSLPIITISSSTNTFKIYKNKIKNESTGTYVSQDMFTMPKDDTYHLIQIYVKGQYNIDSTSYKKISDVTTKAILYFDGVMNTTPFDFIPYSDSTDITINEGSWELNHIGISIFNAVPSTLKNYDESKNDTNEKYYVCIKYYNDFDPYIPAYYYIQWYNNTHQNEQISTFDNSAYPVEGWVNYVGSTSQKIYTKFTSIPPDVIRSLCDLDIFCISPIDDTNPTDYLHKFIRSTMDSIPQDYNKFTENNAGTWLETDGTLLKYRGNKLENVIPDFNYDFNGQVETISTQFQFKFQGSSTLLYGCKSFEVQTKLYTPTILGEQANTYGIYVTLDKDLYLPEKTVNFKSDIVESSHSNNTIIGKFVNAHMTSPYGSNKKAALVGKPICLFIKNNNTSNTNKDTYLFLGIYSIALSRSSNISMGYQNLPEGYEKKYVDGDDKLEYTIVNENNVTTNYGMAVTEVQENDKLFDFSQFNAGVQKSMMFGDYKNALLDNINMTTDYNFIYTNPINWLRSYIYNIFHLGSTTPYFNVIDYNSIDGFLKKPTDYVSLGTTFYYYDENNNKTKFDYDTLKDTACITDTTYTSQLKSYISEKNGVTYILDPTKQFCLIYTDSDCTSVYITSGNAKLFYIKDVPALSNTANYEDTKFTGDKIDLQSAVTYYIIMMAFGMVDSPMKNLTLKRTSDGKWYLAFYDMDTAFRGSNSGSFIDFKAFSAYIKDQQIINDYKPEALTGWFDTPSSYLIMFAKYAAALDSGMNEENKQIDPYNQWIKLRSNDGDLSSANAFSEKYIKPYFGTISPIIWNLDFHYKYFGSSNVTKTSDSEINMFIGDGKYIREEWLNDRLHFIDIMFGILNLQKIGNTSYTIGGTTTLSNASDVIVQNSMFPNFTKGSQISATLNFNAEPQTPFIFQYSSQGYYIWITDDAGNITQPVVVGTNSDLGFYGSQSILSIAEMGDFMTATENKIVNPHISNINITVGYDSTSITITKTNTPSLKSITINYGSTMIKHDTITISADDTDPLVLNSVNLSSFKCSSLKLTNLNIDTLTISKLQVSAIRIVNCNITNFIRVNDVTNPTDLLGNLSCTSIDINNTTITNVGTSSTALSSTYSLGWNFRNVYTTSINLTNVGSSQNISNINIGCANLTSIYLNSVKANNGNITVSSISKLKSIGMETLSCTSLYIYDSHLTAGSYIYNSIYTNSIISQINVTFISSTPYLQISGFINKSFSISISGVTEINLGNNAFFGNLYLADLPDIKYNIYGSNVFGSCSNFSDSMLSKLLNNSKFNFNTCLDFSYMFHAPMIDSKTISTTIKYDFIKNFFNLYGSKIANQSSVQMFSGCDLTSLTFTNSDFSKDLTTLTKYGQMITLINSLPVFKQPNYYIFGYTGLNIMTKDMADKLSGNNTLAFVGQVSNYDINFKNLGYIYIEDTVLGKFTSWNETCYYLNIWHWSVNKLFDTEDIENINQYVLIAPTISKLFGTSSVCTSINGFSIYSDATYPFDMSEGFPSNITFIDNFPGYRGSIYFTDSTTSSGQLSMISAFKNLTTNCEVRRTFDSITNTNMERVDIYNLLVDDTKNQLRCSINQYDGYLNSWEYQRGFTFNKRCTKEHLQKLISLVTASSYKSIRNLFRNCLVEDATEDMLKGILNNVSCIRFAFYNMTTTDGSNPVYFSVDDAFDGTSENTKCVDFGYAFYNDTIKVINKKFNVKKGIVNSMEGMLMNCKYPEITSDSLNDTTVTIHTEEPSSGSIIPLYTYPILGTYDKTYSVTPNTDATEITGFMTVSNTTELAKYKATSTTYNIFVSSINMAAEWSTTDNCWKYTEHESYEHLIVPSDFFDICSTDVNTTSMMEATPESASMHSAWGQLPASSTTWRIGNNIFRYCRIVPRIKKYIFTDYTYKTVTPLVNATILNSTITVNKASELENYYTEMSIYKIHINSINKNATASITFSTVTPGTTGTTVLSSSITVANASLLSNYTTTNSNYTIHITDINRDAKWKSSAWTYVSSETWNYNEDSIEYRWIVFPKWYMSKLLDNQYLTYIPSFVNGTTLYLFETNVQATNIGQLPILKPRKTGNGSTEYYNMISYIMNKTNQTGELYSDMYIEFYGDVHNYSSQYLKQTSTYYYYRFSDRSDLYYLFGELDGIDVDNALIFLIHVPASFIYNWPTGSGARFIYKQKDTNQVANDTHYNQNNGFNSEYYIE